ncbi:MAG TPA: hypothetical protein VN820_06700 [Acidimicrobiales bacterium]|nr:hypothetical protein [Acidimicrobiales bacterium]
MSDADEPIGLDLAAFSTPALFELYAATMAELRERQVIRTKNAPVGDYAEYLVAAAFGGTLVTNSKKGYDVLVPVEGGKPDRYQVKARVVATPPSSGERELSPFRSFGFEWAVIVLLAEADYRVWRAVKVPMQVVSDHATFKAHVNGSVLRATPEILDHPDALDVTRLLANLGGQV